MVKRYFTLNNILAEVLERILNFNRKIKYLIALTVDCLILYITLFLAFYLRFGDLNFSLKLNDYILLISFITFLSLWVSLKIYKHILRLSGSATYTTFLKFIFFYTVIFVTLIFTLRFDGVPRTVSLIQPFLLYFGLIGWRYLFKKFLDLIFVDKRQIYVSNVIVYSKIEHADQAIKAIETNNNFKVINIVNDLKSNDGQYINNIKIVNTEKIKKNIKNKNIELIFFIEQGINKSKKNKILKLLNSFDIPIKVIPELNKYITKFLDQNEPNENFIENLLERDTVFNFKKNIKNSIKDVILITGAGGSIGQELVVQLLYKKVKKLILFDQNEYGLYKTLERIENLKKKNRNFNTSVNIVLGSITSISLVEKTITKFKPTLVYHTAAYKHVPIVEFNPLESYFNNVVGTKTLIDCCYKLNIKKFVLISSDKAVRPSNYMGKTKRISELIVQAYSRRHKDLNYIIVRFGNVLNSSGSVIPKFRSQIRDGGPVTVTHPQVTRYFMTISEAVDLVIAASIIGKGTEVFILDMGRPVRIFELAKKIIKMETNFFKKPVEIKFTGLRPGEKMFEELSISGIEIKTKIPKLLKVEEPFVKYEKLMLHLNRIEVYLKTDNIRNFKIEINNLLEEC